MNIPDASTPNEVRSERSDELIDRRPRIVDGGPPRQSFVRGPVSGPAIVPLAKAETHNDPSNYSESCIEQPLVAPKSDLGGSTASSVTPNSELQSTNFATPSFPRCTGESPRAYSAFITFFQLGHSRSLPAVADKLDESIDAIKRWSSRFNWNDRIHAFHAGILQRQAAAEAAAQQEEAAERAARMAHFRRQEWTAAQKMLSAVECYLETCGEQQVEKMTLSQVAKALNTSSTIGRLALSASDLPEDADSAKSSLQIQFADALKRVYGQTYPPPETKNQTSSAVTPSHVQDWTQSNQQVGTVALRNP